MTDRRERLRRLMVKDTLRSTQRKLEEFHASLDSWLNNLVGRSVPADWREQLMRFVEKTERDGLEITPAGISTIERAILARQTSDVSQFSVGDDEHTTSALTKVKPNIYRTDIIRNGKVVRVTYRVHSASGAVLGNINIFVLNSGVGYEQSLDIAYNTYALRAQMLGEAGQPFPDENIWDGSWRKKSRPPAKPVTQSRAGDHAANRAGESELEFAIFGAGAVAVGHHWTPQSVYKALKRLLTDEAYAVFEAGTEDGIPYVHRYDTWLGVTHAEYNKTVHKLLDNYAERLGEKLDKSAAEKFLRMIATGKKRIDPAFYKANEALFEKIGRWRKGFFKGIAAAEAAARKEPKLTAKELKAIAQAYVNGN